MKYKIQKIEVLLAAAKFAVISTFVLAILAVSVNAQSTDPFSPTPMKSGMVNGRWVTGNPSYYYSFVAGPGVIKISFSAKPDVSVDYFGGELLDQDGRALIPIENQRTKSSNIAGTAGSEGKVFVATYQLKRKQKRVFRFYSGGGTQDTGTYSIRITGAGVSFSRNEQMRRNESATYAENVNLSCLPKSGKLRVVMDDGTVQEINLGRAIEIALKP